MTHKKMGLISEPHFLCGYMYFHYSLMQEG